ncbi:MAG: hypothetical protein LBM01_01590 [Christensenellaceae bacterium]|nr:hypothetical protein [Christensenellaceae bacterium]
MGVLTVRFLERAKKNLCKVQAENGSADILRPVHWAIFLDGCDTVHEYKKHIAVLAAEQIATLTGKAAVLPRAHNINYDGAFGKFNNVGLLEGLKRPFVIDEIFQVAEKAFFINICNHLHDYDAYLRQNSSPTQLGKALHITLYMCLRLDYMLAVYTPPDAPTQIAVIYNAGKKVENRTSAHAARNRRTAERKALKKGGQSVLP